MRGDNWEIYRLEYVVNEGANAVKYLYVNFGNHITSCLIPKNYLQIFYGSHLCVDTLQ